MGETRKRKYDRYTLAYKLQAVKLANHPGVKATDVAESLGITRCDALSLANGAPARRTKSQHSNESGKAVTQKTTR